MIGEMPAPTRTRPRRAAPDPTSGKRALVLCGGGVTGLSYEVGALRALDDHLVGATVNDFDIYVGTSSGAFAGALLANGVTPTDVALAIGGTHRNLRAPGWTTLFRPNVGDMVARGLRLPWLLRDVALEVARHPARLMPLDAFTLLAPLLPSGVFDNRPLMRHIRQGFEREGLADDFRALGADLFVVACALDSGQRVVFSRYANETVPISAAVAASTAVPVLFRPVRIDGVDYVDGGMKGISAIDIAVDRGATLIVVVNALVPVDIRRMGPTPDPFRRQLHSHLSELGMRGVYNQVFRTVLHDGLLDHIRLVRQRRPDVDILLIEPQPDDPKMFFHEVMSFSAQLMVLQHGYESVTDGLLDSWAQLRRILPRHGVHLTRRVAARKPRAVPVESVASPSRLRRLLRQTVFAARPVVQLVERDELKAAS
jgi:NTE family protein